jgi:hypothetical protein
MRLTSFIFVLMRMKLIIKTLGRPNHSRTDKINNKVSECGRYSSNLDYGKGTRYFESSGERFR